MAGGKFGWSNNDPGAIPRNLRKIERESKELSASVKASIGPALSYITQGAGSGYNNETWSLYGTQSTGDNGPVNMAYDPRFDIDLTLEVPFSRRFTVTISAWVTDMVNAYTLTSSKQPIGANLRIGTLIHAYIQDDEPDITGWFGGAQMGTRVWGDNNSIQVATSVSYTQSFVITNDSADLVHIRSRRWYWPAFTDSNDAVIAAPNGSWYRGSVGEVTMQVTPMYTDSKAETTD